MSWKSLVCAGLLCGLAVPAWAVPSITAALQGGGTPVLNGSGQFVWEVRVTPEAPAASIAAEVALSALYGGLTGVTAGADWDRDLPGVAPAGFTWWVTPTDDGIETSGTDAFVSLGSIEFGSTSPSVLAYVTSAEPFVSGPGATPVSRNLTTRIRVWGGYPTTDLALSQNAALNEIAEQTFTFSVVPGDADFSGAAGAGDFLIWKAGLGNKWSTADFDNSGASGGANDFLIWKNSPNTTLPPPGAGAGGGGFGAVPEPSSLILAGIMALALAVGRRTRLA